jgi:hypothetical protein
MCPRVELYDLVLVEPGPLPPHERSWRHPSELGPTRVDVDDPPSNSHLVALVGGTPATALLTSFAAYPHAVTSEPELDLDGTDVADEMPADDDMVLLRTEAVTYRLRWDEVQLVNAPDGSVVFDISGDVVARMAGGELVTLVGG